LTTNKEIKKILLTSKIHNNLSLENYAEVHKMLLQFKRKFYVGKINADVPLRGPIAKHAKNINQIN
jgi:hypothetical protein